jgi:hypothetical protein
MLSNTSNVARCPAKILHIVFASTFSFIGVALARLLCIDTFVLYNPIDLVLVIHRTLIILSIVRFVAQVCFTML